MKFATADRLPGVSERVIFEIAGRKGVDPVEIDEPLYEVIDPDALDSLVESASRTFGRSSVTVSFTYCGYDVTVTGDEEVRVSDALRPGGRGR
jgi:hypothetical protein